MSTPFIEENDQTRTRREHLERIRVLIGNVYPNKFRRTNVTASPCGEDTVSALADRETVKGVVGNEDFARLFDALDAKLGAKEKPTPEDLEPLNAALNKIEVRTSGRLATPPRVMGKAAFVHLSDGKGRLQIYVRRDDVTEMRLDDGRAVNGWELFKLLDHGDFVGVEGFLFVTRTGELSIHVRSFEFLSKALLPMPDKMHGVADPEIRQRQRYVDLLAGSLKIDLDEETQEGARRELTPREVFERRSQVIREMRRYLDDHGYVEVETPILTPLASGAAARPFETYHNALGIPLYARIAPELYLKRLLVGGFERVYELNRNFRNEGISYKHNPEFTMLEFYCAYMDVNGMMDFCEAMLRQTVEKVTGGTSVRFGEYKIDFVRKFERLSMKEAIDKYWPNTWRELAGSKFNLSWLDDAAQVEKLILFHARMEAMIQQNLESHIAGMKVSSNSIVRYYMDVKHVPPKELVRIKEIKDTLSLKNKDSVWKQVEHGFMASRDEHVEMGETRHAQNIQTLFENFAEQHLVQPTFIINFPKGISPLSKASPADPTIAERFELYIMGMECANGFSELNDPFEQEQRFDEQMRQRERGDDEAMQKDVDYLHALSYGMPPAAGIGIGVDRLVMLLTNRRSIRDVILFPHMRPRRAAEGESESEVNSEKAEGESSE